MLDTNICIYLIKYKSPNIIKNLKRQPAGSIGISSIVLAELRFGVEKSQRKKQNHNALEEFIRPLEILPFDDNAAASCGDIRSQLEKAGKPIGSLDTLIGAHALSLGVTLVTNNLGEFKKIKGLKVANWSA